MGEVESEHRSNELFLEGRRLEREALRSRLPAEGFRLALARYTDALAYWPGNVAVLARRCLLHHRLGAQGAAQQDAHAALRHPGRLSAAEYEDLARPFSGEARRCILEAGVERAAHDPYMASRLLRMMADDDFRAGLFLRAARTLRNLLLVLPDEGEFYDLSRIEALRALGTALTALDDQHGAEDVRREILGLIRREPRGSDDRVVFSAFEDAREDVFEVVRARLRRGDFEAATAALHEFHLLGAVGGPDLDLYRLFIRAVSALEGLAANLAQAPDSVRGQGCLDSDLGPAEPRDQVLGSAPDLESTLPAPRRGTLPEYQDFLLGVVYVLEGEVAAGAEHLAAFLVRAQRERPPLHVVYRWEISVCRLAMKEALRRRAA